MLIEVGDKIKFAEEVQRYTVRACDERYAVCTKPFNLKHTVLYTILDLQQSIRGTENLIFCAGFETDQKCQEALERLSSGKTEISSRNWIELHIKNIIKVMEIEK